MHMLDVAYEKLYGQFKFRYIDLGATKQTCLKR